MSFPACLTAATNSSFPVSAVVVPGCLITKEIKNYGDLDFGSHSALAMETVLVRLSYEVHLQCTLGVTLSAMIDGGQYNSGGRNMQLNNGSNKMAYQLFYDSALSKVIEVDQPVMIDHQGGSDISFPIYGRVQLQGDLPEGIYRDVLQVQFSW
ncbi:spore coat U domain-containing protein [Pseudomonas rubra]|uniref:Spore coat U domain-containing protein n=1 Tax=Pseudomonas rubra TaxID=2942627 RepID=A0ABT5PEV1_9PSED|nr:spore coat U domain-containing protein [Pseudomonas rubra]MDD1016732.1 spore coat U domain-containing protein [Pseudomonas rubra]MDD1157718.1 spore coat U domain-containing protein [Pseudomonas rubra]